MRNLPWWARDLAHSDVVAGEFHGHALIGARVVKIFRMTHRVRPGGWRSLAGMRSAPICVARLSAARAELMALGAVIESRTWLRFAVGVPPGVDAAPIEAALEREEGRGDFEWVALADDRGRPPGSMASGRTTEARHRRPGHEPLRAPRSSSALAGPPRARARGRAGDAFDSPSPGHDGLGTAAPWSRWRWRSAGGALPQVRSGRLPERTTTGLDQPHGAGGADAVIPAAPAAARRHGRRAKRSALRPAFGSGPGPAGRSVGRRRLDRLRASRPRVGDPGARANERPATKK